MRIPFLAGATALALGMAAAPAGAETVVYYRAGSWDAFSGTGTDGRPVCGVGSTNPTDNRSFSIRFPVGSDVVLFQARKPTWNIPAGSQISVVVQVGLDSPWTVQGNGNENTVEWSLDRGAIQTFDQQFRRGSSMTVTFPSGNEPPWTVGLNGSTAISNAFGRCITDMAARGDYQQTAPAQTGPTQPFGPGAPGAPGTPGAPGAPQDPTQPTTR